MKANHTAKSIEPGVENWGMLGHEWAVNMLKGHISRQNLRHAYLFTGPAGVGRRTLAMHFTQAINCPTPLETGVPCQSCQTCEQIAASRYPDLNVVQSEHTGATLKVDQIRELQRSLSLAPYTGAYRVALLLRFEEANPSTANALLKTLEEPASRVILLLTAESAEVLLPTVVSRCELFRLRPVSPKTLGEKLAELWGAPEEEATLLAHLSGGRPGYAHYLLHHPDALQQRQDLLEEHRILLYSSRVARFSYAEKFTKNKDALRNSIQVWETFWRDIMLQKASSSASRTNIDRLEEISDIAAKIPLGKAHHILNSLQTARRRLDRNANVRLAAETLLLDLPFLG